MENLNVAGVIDSIQDWSLDDLHELSKNINLIIKNKSSFVQVELCYSRFKGSGKCWIAEVDSDTRKILSFIEAESDIKQDKYRGSKIYRLKDGYYLFVEMGTKSHDDRKYIKVENGKMEDAWES